MLMPQIGREPSQIVTRVEVNKRVWASRSAARRLHLVTQLTTHLKRLLLEWSLQHGGVCPIGKHWWLCLQKTTIERIIILATSL